MAKETAKNTKQVSQPTLEAKRQAAGQKPVDNKEVINKQIIQSLMSTAANASLVRSDLLRKLLNPNKDINYVCGYPDAITMDEYKRMDDREGLGSRVVAVLPEESWAMPPTVYETEKSDETEFEKAWKALQREKCLFHYLQRVDVLSGLGRFGLLLLGINDGKELNLPVEGIDLKTGKSSKKNKYELLYLRVFDESSIEIKTKETDVTNPRFGYPTMYSINFEGTGVSGSAIQTKQVHWTRVIHIADGKKTSEVFGTPRMKPVYNRLLDIRKVLSGSGEMFWKGAFPGYAFEINPEITTALTDDEKTALRTEFENYSSGLQRYLAITGVTAKSLTPQVSDPKGHLDAQIRYIALVLGIPYRIFIGTEEAKLAGTQDMITFNKRIAKRREDYLTPAVISPFIDRLIALGVLPEPKEYFVDWPDLSTPSDKEKAEVAKARTEALAKYVVAGVDSLIPPKEYLMIVMGMEEKEAAAIEKAALEHMEEKEEEGELEEPKPGTEEEE